MKFRTEITVNDAPRKLSPERLVLLVGSCFSDNIGAKMSMAGWPVEANPCGVVYNPVSMAILFQLALTHRPVRREIIASGLTERDGAWVTWFMSSKVTAPTPEECIDNACAVLDRLESAIERAQAVILTAGTPDVWLLRGTDRAVGNCHKHPASEFERRRAGIDEIAGVWKELICAVRERNPECDFILTLSPRRYLAEGFADNTRQKAVLALAWEKLCAETERTAYFPAYEIMNDDLRDYRFYSSDLLHPSDSAIDYIWEKFVLAYVDTDGREKLREGEKAWRRSNHRPSRT